jgi:hypothetical protein
MMVFAAAMMTAVPFAAVLAQDADMIVMKNFDYSPMLLTVKPGTLVTWKNLDGESIPRRQRRLSFSDRDLRIPPASLSVAPPQPSWARRSALRAIPIAGNGDWNGPARRTTLTLAPFGTFGPRAA